MKCCRNLESTVPLRGSRLGYMCVGEGEGREGGRKGGEWERTGNVISFLFIPGVVPAETAGWCGAVSPTDGAELSGAVQAGQVLSHLPAVGHGWGPSPGG